MIGNPPFMASRSRVYHYVFIVLIIINDDAKRETSQVCTMKGWLNPRLIIALCSHLLPRSHEVSHGTMITTFHNLVGFTGGKIPAMVDLW